MNRIVALGGSNSRNSINRQFAYWAASKTGIDNVELIDLNEYEMPIYSADLEKEQGIPESVHDLREMLESASGFVISLAEHNGNYTAVFKNILDWLSRLDRNIWGNKPTLLLATSPGPSGGKSVLKIAKESFPYLGARVSGVYSLPAYHKNFNPKDGIVDQGLLESFGTEMNKFDEELHRIKEVME
ncbi:MAG: NAD(P)H-dependent oxidoreductase [Cytophagales bacterium]|nr:NAD(P)H-dependent oxidoreductase [Cytophagales bacterium]